MLSKIAQTFISVGVILALLVMTMQPAMSAPAQSQPKPSDFFWGEVAAGTLGEALGLTLSAWIAFGCPAGILDFSGTSICKPSPSYPSVLTLVYSLLFGIPVGASLGVIFMGSLNGIQGSPPATVGSAYLGMIGGLVVGAVVGSLVSSLVDTGVWLVVSTTLAGTAIGAAYGYNQGAKMKSDKSKRAALSWQLPLVSVKF